MNTKLEKLEDEELVVLFVQHQDEKAFSSLYKRYFLSLAKYIGWLTNDRSKGKDIAQNIFLKIYQSPTLFDTSRRFKTWLFVIAKNQWKNELRNHSNREKHKKILAITLGQKEETTEDNRLKNLSKALEQLTEAHKEVFVLKYSNGLTIKEIAQILDCSEGTVKSRLFYALKKTKEFLQNYEKKEVFK
ncbi:MAG: RNA polymerase sigma factor [Aureispira sp.]|nr:RNA polymerase sigma factor [Aureispira sp.]